MNSILKFLMPNEDKFFSLLNEQADNLLESGNIFFNSIEKYNQLSIEERKERQKKIKDMEEVGDTISYNIIEQIDKNLITPFDKEDIHELTILIDDILDSIDATFRRIIYCDLQNTDDIILNLNKSILDSIKAIHFAINDLKTLTEIKSYCTRIEMLENQSDTLLALGLVYLFQNVKDPIILFKTKEIYEYLESVTDRCKVVSRVLRSIMVKHG
jgi:uncharacterized protein Yka (UPF0111/DUF47 family)